MEQKNNCSVPMRIVSYDKMLRDVRENGTDSLIARLMAMHDDCVAGGDEEYDLALAALMLMEKQGSDNDVCEIYFDTDEEYEDED